MKDKKQKQKKPRERKPFKEEFGNLRPFKLNLKDNWIAIFGIPICIGIVILALSIFIGDGPHSYSDNIYRYIESSISTYVGEEIGPDSVKLSSSLSKDGIDEFLFIESLAKHNIDFFELKRALTEENPDAKKLMESLITEEAKNNKETINLGENSQKGKLDGSFELSYKDGQNILTCSIKKGFFLAKVTVVFTENYEPISSTRNFTSFEQYKLFFYTIFGTLALFLGLLLWVGIVLIWNIPIWLRAKRTNNEAQPAATRSNNDQEQPQIISATIVAPTATTVQQS